MQTTRPILPLTDVRSRGELVTDTGIDLIDVVRHATPEGCIEMVDVAGLRGRGGAWFPTAEKWRTTRRYRSAATPATIVVNAAEGEPGSMKDRMLLRRDPYSVLEGAIVAARAIEADTVVVAIKQSFHQEIARVRQAIVEIEPLLTGLVDRIVVVEGPERYLFGEESALLEVVAGRRPFPRLSPPWRQGLDDAGQDGEPGDADFASPAASDLVAPVLVQNVETLARVAHVVRSAALGDSTPTTSVAATTFLATVTGDVARHGVVEQRIGATINDLIAAVGGAQGEVGSVLNGVSYPIIPADRLDLPLGPDAPSVPIGAAAFQIFDDTRDPVAIAAGVARFLSVESCGQCEPCKSDGLDIHRVLSEMRDGAEPDERHLRDLDDLARRVTVGARCGLAQQQAESVDGLLASFAGAMANAAPSDPVLIAPLDDIVDGVAVIARRHDDVQPDWSRDLRWSGRYPASEVEVDVEVAD